MPRALRGALLLFIVIAGGGAASAESPSDASAARIEQTAALFILRVPLDPADALTALVEAIKRRNYFVVSVNPLDQTLSRRAAGVGAAPLLYEEYKVVSFCNLTLADEAIRLNPLIGALMPCRAVVFRVRGARETTIATFRPSFFSAHFEAGGMKRVVAQVEADILEILKGVAGE